MKDEGRRLFILHPSSFILGLVEAPVVVLSLLAFLIVALFIIVGHQLIAGWLNPDSARVAKRMAEEFGDDRGQDAASTLYKNLEHLKLDSASDPLAAADAPPPLPPSVGVLENTAQWLEQAHLPCTPGQFFLIVTGISL